MWTGFKDQKTVGRKKGPYKYVFIEAPRQEASVVYYGAFGVNPENETCESCGDDYRIVETKTLYDVIGYFTTLPIKTVLETWNVKVFKKEDIKDEWWDAEVPEDDNTEVTCPEHGEDDTPRCECGSGLEPDDEDECDDCRVGCSNCGTRINPDETYCEDCQPETCQRCGDELGGDDCDKGDSYCSDCRPKKCRDCGEFLKGEDKEIDDGYCEDCRPAKCQTCGDELDSDDADVGDDYCSNCRPEPEFEGEHCSWCKVVLTQFNKDNHKGYCEPCWSAFEQGCSCVDCVGKRNKKAEQEGEK